MIYLTWLEPLRLLAPAFVIDFIFESHPIPKLASFTGRVSDASAIPNSLKRDSSTSELYQEHFNSLLLQCIPSVFPSGLKTLFANDLANSNLLHHPISTDSPATPIQQLATLGLLSRFQPILFSVGYDSIDQRIKAVCEGRWQGSEASLDSILAWFRKDIGIWLFKLFECSLDHHENQSTIHKHSGDRDEAIAIMRPAISRFEYHIFKCISELRYVFRLLSVPST